MKLLDKLTTEWRDSLQLTNAFYSLYKTHRQRTDSFESQLIEQIKLEPLSDKDWQRLRERVEGK